MSELGIGERTALLRAEVGPRGRAKVFTHFDAWVFEIRCQTCTIYPDGFAPPKWKVRASRPGDALEAWREHCATEQHAAGDSE